MEIAPKQNTYNFLMFLTLASFGFFGSLSHVFSLTLIVIMVVTYVLSAKEGRIPFQPIALFFFLNSYFFLSLLIDIFRTDFASLMEALSPNLPLPLIGLLIIFHNSSIYKLSSSRLSIFSQVSVFISMSLYLLLPMLPDPNSFYYKFYAGRLELFSGNPIPFSFVLLGISFFCLSNWKNSTNRNKLIAFILFLAGVYLGAFCSGTRGTLLSLLIVLPIIIFYLTYRVLLTLLIILTFGFIFLLMIKYGAIINFEDTYFSRVKNGLETLIFSTKIDGSIWQRLAMWSAAIEAISNGPLFGYGTTERYTALKPYLDASVQNYSHPHNDILAGFISIGFLGSIAAFISLCSGFLASLLSPFQGSRKLCFGLMISCVTLVTANVSTVFFNDISAAWLAFSAYLIWATDFGENEIGEMN